MQHFLLSSPEKMDKRMWSFVIDKADRRIREIGFSFYIDMVDLRLKKKAKTPCPTISGFYKYSIRSAA